MLLVGTIENNVLTGIWQFTEETWASIGPIFQAAFPQWEYVMMTDLPEGAWIGWYRVDGVWYDPDPPSRAAERLAAK